MLYGNNVGVALTTGQQNSAFGTEALRCATTGGFNSAFGGSAFKYGLLTTSGSVAVGNASGMINSVNPNLNWVGNNDTFLGSSAGVWGNTWQVNAATSAGNAVLHFAAVPSWVNVGHFVDDYSNPGVIPTGAYVIAKTGTTVTLSANVTGAGVGSSDSITFWGATASLTASAATASGNTLTFASVPGLVVAGMIVQDTTAPSVIPAGTTVTATTLTTVTLSNNVTGAGVGNGDTIVFGQNQFDVMTVIGAFAAGNRNNTIFIGRPLDTVIIAPTPGNQTSVAALTIGAGSYGRAAIHLEANAPGGVNPATAGDLWFNSGYLYFNNGSASFPLNMTWTFTPSGTTGGPDYFSGAQVGNTTLGGSGLQGCNNVLAGSGSIGQNLTTGYNNTAFGGGTFTSLTAGHDNTVLGYTAGINISTGNDNVIIGSSSGTSMNSGYMNTIVGYGSGTAMTSANYNVVVGNGCGNSIVSGSGNTIVGESIGGGSGNGNILLGYATATGLTNGGGNTVIGNQLSVSNVSNTLLLGVGNATPIIVGDTTSVRPQYQLKTIASIASAASLNIPSGTAPTTPNSGDLWFASGSLYFNNGSANVAISSAFTGDSGSGGSVGLVPAPASGTAAAGKFLKADGTWSVPGGGSSLISTFTPSGGSTANLFAGPAAGNQTMGGTSSQGVANTLVSPAPLGRT